MSHAAASAPRIGRSSHIGGTDSAPMQAGFGASSKSRWSLIHTCSLPRMATQCGSLDAPHFRANVKGVPIAQDSELGTDGSTRQEDIGSSSRLRSKLMAVKPPGILVE